jgi:hypothetical protein
MVGVHIESRSFPEDCYYLWLYLGGYTYHSCSGCHRGLAPWLPFSFGTSCSKGRPYPGVPFVPMPPSALQFEINPGMQSITEANRQFKDTIVGGQNKLHYAWGPGSPSRSRSDRGAFEQLPGLLRQRPIQILGDVVPDVFAIYDHGGHLLFDVRLMVFNWRASCFCNIIRARCNRTLTLGTLIFNAWAVSLLLSSSTSRRRKT